MRIVKWLLIALVVLVTLSFGFVYAGVFNVAADNPHWALTHGLIEAVREQSIVQAARSAAPPPALDSPQLIALGAQEYDEMCTGCHLAPGMEETELRAGLYPKPPNFSEPRPQRKPSETFWVIKHGLKMTGMPAWGLTHDDRRLWSMVAFLQKLPKLSESQYHKLIEQAGAFGDMHHEHGHSHSEGAEPGDAHEHHHDGAGTAESAGHAQEPEDAAPTHEHSNHSHEQAQNGAVDGAPLPASAIEPVALVDRFFHALATDDTKGALGLLDPSVLIYESGDAERSRQAYAAHHLGADAAFLKSAKHRLISRTGDAVGDLAWVATEARLISQGAKPTDVVSTETVVLRKAASGWRIVHIHWSSGPA